MADFTITRGDDETIELLVTDPEQEGEPPVDLSGTTLWWYVKTDPTMSDANAILKKSTADSLTIVDGPGGRADIVLVPDDTRDIALQYLDTELQWELQLKDGANKIRTVGRGSLIIESDLVIAEDDLVPSPLATYTYDPTTSAGRVRLLCQDFDQADPIFSDAEIDAFLDMNDQDVRYAAALALEVLAANEVYVQKRIKILDLWTDGPREAEQLLRLAISYREQANTNATVEEMFDWAEHVYDDFSWVERVNKEFMRGFA